MRRGKSRSREASPGAGEKMPKPASSKWRQPFWFVVFVSFLLSFLLLFYLYHSSSLVKHNGVIFFTQQPEYGFAHSVVDYGTIINDHLDELSNGRRGLDDDGEADPEKEEKPETDDDEDSVPETDDNNDDEATEEVDKPEKDENDTVEVTEEVDKPEKDEEATGDDADQDSVSETEQVEKPAKIDATNHSAIHQNKDSIGVTEEEGSAIDRVSVLVTEQEEGKQKLDDGDDQGSVSVTKKVEKPKIDDNATSNVTAVDLDSVSGSGKGVAVDKLQVEEQKKANNATRNGEKSIEGRKNLNLPSNRIHYLNHGSSISNQTSNDTVTNLEEQGNVVKGGQNVSSHGGLGVRENAEKETKIDSGESVAEKLPNKTMSSESKKGSVRENRGNAEEVQRTGDRGRHKETPKVSDNLNTSEAVDSCRGRYIYIHELPSLFNEDMIKNCKSLNKWLDMCKYMTNFGLGPQLDNTLPEFSDGSWFSTNQFALELIFHHRMKQYKCLTKDSSKANAIYVPYYSGLDVSRYLWYDRSLKDSAALDLVAWLRDQEEWKRMWGRDHFFVAGRITWDFRREGDNLTNWGNKLMYLPESKNMTILTIESSPWHRNDFAVPYPSYFHPKTDDEIRQWQHKVRKMKRKYLFCFAGGARPNLRNDIRGQIFNQCEAAKHKCKLLECVEGNSTCYEPANLMNMFESSVFCLQPSGDSFTRRSTFDSILAGCIPVFFHPGSAYVQYLWHFPKEFEKYSVYIPAKDVKEKGVSIERVLGDIPREKVVEMREQLIRLIPKITYVYPRFGEDTYKDAFDIAVDGVLERVEMVREEMEEGKNGSFGFEEEQSWKWFRNGEIGKHEWDDLFDRSGEMKFIY